VDGSQKHTWTASSGTRHMGKQHFCMRNQASAENPTWNEITTIKRGERRKNLPSALAGMPFPLEPIPPGFASPGPCCENCKIRIPESEAGGLRAPGQPGLHSETLSQKKKQTKQN
jgi:hypothetical protein